MNNIKDKARMAAMLTIDLSERIDELDGHVTTVWDDDFIQHEGKGKTQLHNDIVQIRRLLLQIDKEVMKS